MWVFFYIYFVLSIYCSFVNARASVANDQVDIEMKLECINVSYKLLFIKKFLQIF